MSMPGGGGMAELRPRSRASRPGSYMRRAQPTHCVRRPNASFCSTRRFFAVLDPAVTSGHQYATSAADQMCLLALKLASIAVEEGGRGLQQPREPGISSARPSKVAGVIGNDNYGCQSKSSKEWRSDRAYRVHDSAVSKSARLRPMPVTQCSAVGGRVLPGLLRPAILLQSRRPLRGHRHAANHSVNPQPQCQHEIAARPASPRARASRLVAATWARLGRRCKHIVPRWGEVHTGLRMASGIAQSRSSVASTSPSISIDPIVIGSTTSCRCVAPALAIAAR